MVNAKFDEKELAYRIDHRSYGRQGLDLLQHFIKVINHARDF